MATSCGWVNLRGLNRWEYGGKAWRPASKACRATANVDLVVRDIPPVPAKEAGFQQSNMNLF
jgi:hypothetical protein